MSVASALNAMLAGAEYTAPFAGLVSVTLGNWLGSAARADVKASSRPPDATTPDHCADALALSSRCAFSALTDRSGFIESSSAATPATWGAAMLVPLAAA